MKASCPVCSAIYPIPDDKVGVNGLPVRCKKCKAVFRVFNDSRESIVETPPSEPEESYRSRKPETASVKPEPPKPEPPKEKPVTVKTVRTEPKEEPPKPSARESKRKQRVVKTTRITAPESDSLDDDLPFVEAAPLPPEPEVIAEAVAEPIAEVVAKPTKQEKVVEAVAEPLVDDDNLLEATAEPLPEWSESDAYVPHLGAKRKADEEELDEDFFKVQRFGGDTQKLLKIGLFIGLALIVLFTVIGIWTLVSESDKAFETVEQQRKNSAQNYEDNLKKIDHINKYQEGLRSANAGTEDAYLKAIDMFDRSLEAKADYAPALAVKAEVLGLLAIEYNRTDGVELACQLAEKALAAEKSPAAYRAQGACLIASDKLDEADKAIHDALTVVEGDTAEDANSNYLLALFYIKKGDKDKALFTLTSAIQFNPFHFRAQHLLADIYASKKDWKKAAEYENKAVSLMPTHMQAKERLALYQQQASGELSQTALVPGMSAELGSELDKKSMGEKLLARAREASNRGQTPEALGLINDLLKLGTHTGQAYMLKCQMLVNRGSYQAAVDACGSARNYSPDAYYYLGAAYEAMGDQTMKKTNYQAYLNARPDGAHATEVRSILGQTGQ